MCAPESIKDAEPTHEAAADPAAPPGAALPLQAEQAVDWQQDQLQESDYH